MERYERVWNVREKRYERVHRLVAERMLGRALTPGEVVHHLNGDCRDNRPENLRVLPSQAHHMAVEHMARKRGRGQEPLFDLDTPLG